MQAAVTDYFSSKQLVLLVFASIQRQTTVTAYFSKKQLLLSISARHFVRGTLAPEGCWE